MSVSTPQIEATADRSNPTKTTTAEDTINAESEYTEADYRRLLRKIDLWLLPLMWVCYGTQQADKVSLSTQAVFGIREDTGLVDAQFNWLSTIFYLTYLVCETPASWLMQKCHIGMMLSVVMVLWGLIVLCIAFAKNFAHLAPLRALQGALECSISPTFLLLTGVWYTSQEHALRAIIWGTSNAGIHIITGLIMYGIGNHAQENPGGLPAWTGISFFLGALTICCGIAVWFILGTPREVRWLSEDEKRAAIARVVANQTGSDREKRTEFKWSQVVIAFKDPQAYFFFFVTVVNALPNGASTTLSNLLCGSFGFSSLDTLLKGNTPYNCISICWFLLIGYINLKKPNLRFLFMMLSLLPAFTGMLALSLLPTDSMQWTRWGMYIMGVTGLLPGILIWTFLPSNVAGRTKKTITSAVIFVRRAVSCFWLSFVGWGVGEGINRRRAKIIEGMGISREERERLGKLNAEADMTDRENVFFRYQY